MSDKKIIAVVGATGSQGGGLVRAILNDPAAQLHGPRDHAERQFGERQAAGETGRRCRGGGCR